MEVDIREVGAESLPQYETIPSCFLVESVYRVVELQRGLGGFALLEERVEPAYVKDYDRQAVPDARPTSWPTCLDTRQWGFFIAFDADRPVGGATLAWNTPDVHMLERRRELAVLWDIRVHPEYRERGIGTRLFQCAAGWARRRGCRQLKIETQNVNVRACRFYARQGCALGAIHRFAYMGCPDVAHEAMLLWYLDL